MRFVGLCALLIFASSPSPVRADDSIPVVLQTTDGSSVGGTVALKGIKVKGKLGEFELAASALSSIISASKTTADGKQVVRIETVRREVIIGVIESPEEIEVKSAFGRLTTTWNDVQTLTFRRAIEPSTVLAGPPGMPVEAIEPSTVPAGPLVEDVQVSQAMPSVENTLASWRVQVESRSGERLAGTLRLDVVVIVCDLGILDVRAEKIKELRLDDEGKGKRDDYGTDISGTLVTAGGKTLKGTVTIPHDWALETDLGTLEFLPEKLRSVTFDRPLRPEDREGFDPTPSGSPSSPSRHDVDPGKD